MAPVPLHIRQECIRLLLLDVDGVLTDGRLSYGPAGEALKHFNVRDGLGIRLLQAAGVTVGIVTGRSGEPLLRRCRDLGIARVLHGVRDKGAVLPQLLADGPYEARELAFMGDDLPDLPLMRQVGLAVAVADAPVEVTARAHWVTRRRGGHGAVREVCEGLLKAQGRWHGTVEQWTQWPSAAQD